MEALKRSIGNEAQATKGKKPRKAAAGQKEMLLPISGKRAAKQDTSQQRRELGSVYDRSKL
jgi:DNA end-binding protein Ku